MSHRYLLVAGFLAAVVAAVGCGSSSDPAVDSAEATICVHLQDLGLEMAQEWIDVFERSDVTIEDWEASPDAPFGEGRAGAFLARREALVERWDGYDCAGGVFDAVSRRSDELVWTEPIGEYLVEVFKDYD